jgi:hypothetical protein
MPSTTRSLLPHQLDIAVNRNNAVIRSQSGKKFGLTPILRLIQASATPVCMRREMAKRRPSPKVAAVKLALRVHLIKG